MNHQSIIRLRQIIVNKWYSERSFGIMKFLVRSLLTAKKFIIKVQELDYSAHFYKIFVLDSE